MTYFYKIHRYIKRHPVICLMALLHVALIFLVAPYILCDDYCNEYTFTFPYTRPFCIITVSLGILMAAGLVVWFYNYYLLIAWRRLERKTKLFSIAVASFFVSYALFTYPYMFALDGDFTALLDMSSHGIPYFWQNYLTSVVYLAYMLIFFHPFSVILVQCILAIIVYTYIVDCCLKLIPNCRRSSYAVVYSTAALLMLLSSRLNTMPIVPHRISLWSVYALYHIACCLFHFLDKSRLQQFVGSRTFYLQCILAGILAFWRTEAILFLAWLPVTLIISKYSRRVFNAACNLRRPLIKGTLISFLIFTILSIPQHSASALYYKDDYTIVSCTGFLKEMIELNADLDYDGAADDLATINSFTPLALIKQYGSGAYHIGCEQRTGNCSMSGLTDEDRLSYKTAVVHIIRHNPITFLKARFLMFAKTIGYIDSSDIVTGFYEIYLTGYGGYMDSVLIRLKQTGIRPIYLQAFLNNACSGICFSWAGFFIICTGIILLLIFLAGSLFRFCIRIKTISAEERRLIFKYLISSFLLLELGMALYVLYMAVASLTVIDNSISSLQAVLDTLLLFFSTGICILSVRRKDYMVTCTVIFLFVCLLPFFLLAPTCYWVYYSGIFCCLSVVLCMYCCHGYK